MIAIVTVRPVFLDAKFGTALTSLQDTLDKSNKLDTTIDELFIFFLF